MATRLPLVKQRTGTKAQTSAEELSRLIREEIDIAVGGPQILDLFYVKFHLISQLAHEIHDGIERDEILRGELQKRVRKVHP